ncbi:hypothetical protein JST97_21215 [bacterium]|nr:hypothetical protein [bacterium]
MRNVSPLAHTSPFCGPQRPPGKNTDCEQRRGASAKGLIGAAGMAVITGVTMAPQVAQAANLGKAVATANPGLTDMFTSSTTQVGDYSLHFRPADLDISPRLHGLKPGLRAKGEFLDAELSKSVKLDEGWTRTQGLRGRLHGDINTFGEVNGSLNMEAFRRWEGSLKPGLQARFEVSGGAYQDLVHSSTNVGFQAYQELKGGDFTWHNQPLSWHMEGRQWVGKRVAGGSADSPSRQYSYEFLVGVRRDYPMQVFGHNAILSAVVGPDFHGNQDKSFGVSPKLKVRLQMK